MTLDFIIPYRDRDLTRVKNCIDSIANQSILPNRIIFVDYGSSLEYQSAVTKYLTNQLLVEYVYSYSQGHFWNRSHALNIGIKKSTADFVIMADIDIIYPTDFLKVVIDRLSKHSNRIYHYKTIYLQEGELPSRSVKFYKKNRKISGDTARGLAIYPRLELAEIKGFDEFYCIWGEEDIELSSRIKKKYGLEEQWIEESFTFHQWHLSANKLPLGWGEVIYRHKSIGNKKPSFGNIINNKDRVLPAHIENEDFNQFERFEFSYPYEMSYVLLARKIDLLEPQLGIIIELKKPNLFKINSLTSRIFSFTNTLLAFFKVGYRITDIDKHHRKTLPFENVLAYLFFYILNMDTNKLDYFILDLESKAIICFMKKINAY